MGYPANVTFQHQERSSRLWALLTLISIKGITLIPHFVVLLFLQIGAAVVSLIGIFAVLFTGKYPMGMERFLVNVGNWQWRVASFYMCLSDKYPPFAMQADYPAQITLEHQETSSRLWALLTIIPIKYILIIPHIIVAFILEIAFFFAMIFGLLGALFMGRYPMWAEKVVVTFMRYMWRIQAYFLCLTDKYPPIGWGEDAGAPAMPSGMGMNQ